MKNKHDMSISNNSARHNGKVGLFGSYCRAGKLKLIGRKLSGSKFSKNHRIPPILQKQTLFSDAELYLKVEDFSARKDKCYSFKNVFITAAREAVPVEL